MCISLYKSKSVLIYTWIAKPFILPLHVVVVAVDMSENAAEDMSENDAEDMSENDDDDDDDDG